MRSFRKLDILYIAVFMSLILLSACAAGPKKLLVLEPQFSDMNILRISLLPVVFEDQAQDRYYQMRAADQILLSSVRALRKKGYVVDLIENSTDRKFWQPYVQPEKDPARLAEFADRHADALVIIWVDHFLDAGIYDRVTPLSLQIHATAAMISPPWRRGTTS